MDGDKRRLDELYGEFYSLYLASFADAKTSNVYVYVKDEAGNIGSANTAIIGDTTPPIVNGAVTSSTTGNAGYVKNGQTLSIGFAMLETGSGLNARSLSVKIGGQAATIGGSYPNFTASLAISGSEATMAEGVLNYTIDAADNVGNVMTEVSGSTGILYDRTPPTFIVGTITTSGNPGYAKTGDTITVPFTASETGSGLDGAPGVTIDGQTATVSGSYPTYTATYKILGSETEGTSPFAISATDKAGNIGSLNGTTSIVVDHTPPAVTLGTFQIEQLDEYRVCESWRYNYPEFYCIRRKPELADRFRLDSLQDSYDYEYG